MDIRALEQEVDAVWVEFMDAEVLLAFADIDELEKIVKRNTTFKYKGAHKKSENTDSIAVVKAVGKLVVKDWKGITLEGEEFPYTEENCDMLMSRWPAFAGFVQDASMDLANFGEQEREADEKNS